MRTARFSSLARSRIATRSLALPTGHPMKHVEPMNQLGGLVQGLDRLQGVSLFPHQADGVAFLISKAARSSATTWGSAKPARPSSACRSRRRTGMILVVCPASLKLNWRREIRMVDPAARIEVLGVADGAQTDPRWVIVNYDLLARNAERLHGIQLGRRHPRRSALHQEQQPANVTLPQAAWASPTMPVNPSSDRARSTC